MAKIKTVGTISEFMAGKHRQPAARRTHKWARVGVVAGTTVVCLAFGDVSFAAAGTVNGAVTAKVIGAFTPVVDLVRALSYPIGLVMMLGGGLFVMIGNSERGFAMIQKAGLGYVLIQMLPILMDLLVEIAKSF